MNTLQNGHMHNLYDYSPMPVHYEFKQRIFSNIITYEITEENIRNDLLNN